MSQVKSTLYRFVILCVGFGVAVFLIWGVREAYPQPAPVTVQPAYGGAPYQLLGGQGGMTAADAKRIVELLESIDKRLASLESAGGVKSAQPKRDLLAVAKGACASCHTPGKAEQRGGGFILFADEAAAALKPLNSREKARIKESVVSGMMPPAGKLSPADRSAFE